MSLEYFLHDPGPVEFLQVFSTCLKSVGTEAFNQNFLELIEKVIRSDQCLIFIHKSDRPECCLSYHQRQKPNAENFAQKYQREGFKADPLLDYIEDVRASSTTKVINLDEVRSRMSSEHQEDYFTTPGIVDKISVLSARDGNVVSMNFYRFEENGPFIISESHVRETFWETIVQLVLLHFSDNTSVQAKSPLNSLSKREREICEAMLRGLTAHSIAWELNIAASTVTTYRKRAYEKLGINSKSALFALCK